MSNFFFCVCATVNGGCFSNFIMEVASELLMEYSEDPEMARLGVRVILLILQEFYNGSKVSPKHLCLFYFLHGQHLF